MKEKEVAKTAISLTSLYFIYRIVFGKFDYISRKEIKERAGGSCETCGASGRFYALEASHIDHSRENEHYNDPDNGRMQCRPCHYNYHLSYKGRAREIGLAENENNWAIKKIWERMDEVERSDALHQVVAFGI